MSKARIVACRYLEKDVRPGWIRVPHSERRFKLTPEARRLLAYFASDKPKESFFSKHRGEPWRRVLRQLLDRGAILDAAVQQDALFRIEAVQIDPNTSCNQRCVYCPVSLKPKPRDVMSLEDFRAVMERLSPFRATIKSIALSSYNEPTIDPFFLARVRVIREAGFDYWLISNGSGLTQAKVDALLALGVRTAELNIPAVDRAEYKRLKGVDDLPVVLRNVGYLLARGMRALIQVQGLGGASHLRNFFEARSYFRGSRARVVALASQDRAGRLPAPWNMSIRHQSLHGCRCNGSRPINWLHINARGDCFLCCQDFDEKYIVGNVLTTPVEQIMAGEPMRRLRRWTYGLEASPADFICRSCSLAITTPPCAGADEVVEPGVLRLAPLCGEGGAQVRG